MCSFLGQLRNSPALFITVFLAHILFFFGRRSIMDTMSRSFRRRTNAGHRAAAAILGADSTHLRQKGRDWVIPFFSPNSLKTNNRHTEGVGRFFEASILDTVIPVTGFVPVFHSIRHQTKCHSMQGSFTRKLLKTKHGRRREGTRKRDARVVDSLLGLGPLFSAESGNLPASRGHRIAFQEEPRHAIE